MSEWWSAASPMNGWERILHTVERTQSWSVRGSRAHACVIFSNQRRAMFRRSWLSSLGLGWPDSCRCVCVALCGFSARGPRWRFRWQSFFSRHHDANWGRGRGRQPQHMNNCEICMCTCLCSKESLCSDISNVACVNWRPRSAAQFPCLSSDCGLLRILAVSPDNLRARRHCLRSWRRWAPSTSGATF